MSDNFNINTIFGSQSSTLFRSVISIAMGLVYGLAFAPFNSIFALIVALSFLFLMSINATSLQSIVSNSVLFGLSYHYFSVGWMIKAIQPEIRDLWSVLLITGVIIPVYLSMYFAIPSMIAHMLRSNPFYAALGFALFWALGEFFRTSVFVGFSWNPIGSVFLDIAQISSAIHYCGIYIFGGLMVFVILGFIVLLRKNTIAFKITSFAFQASIVSALLYSSDYFNIRQPKMGSGPSIKIRIIQSNIPSDWRWVNNYFSCIMRNNHFTTFDGNTKDIKYFISSETSTPLIFSDCKNPHLKKFSTLMEPEQFLIMGVLKEHNQNYYISMIASDYQGRVSGSYDKIRQVPFSEYIPLLEVFRRLHPLVVDAFSASTPGTTSGFRGINHPNALPLICYESAFPAKYDPNIDFIINISNDGRFFGSFGSYQALRLARIRAIEQNKPLVRATNMGISALISPRGEIKELIKLGEDGYLDVEIIMRK